MTGKNKVAKTLDIKINYELYSLTDRIRSFQLENVDSDVVH